MAFTPDALIAVESKARETFEEEVRNWVYEEEAINPRSPPHRLCMIEKSAEFFGVSADLMELRYQLLHRTFAAALVARTFRRKSAWMFCGFVVSLIGFRFCTPNVSRSSGLGCGPRGEPPSQSIEAIICPGKLVGDLLPPRRGLP
jgi:hypothetical protein